MPQYVCYFERIEVVPRELPRFDLLALAQALRDAWGPTDVEQRGLFVRVRIDVSAILSEKQRRDIKRQARRELEKLLPGSRFQASSSLKRQPPVRT